MTVTKSKTLADVHEDVWQDDLLVTNQRQEVTLACDWPQCTEELTSIVSSGFMKKQGWRYCGTGKEHLCDKHSHHTDEELAAGDSQ